MCVCGCVYGIVELGCEVEEALFVTPRVEDGLRLAVGHYLAHVVQIEAYATLRAVVGVELGRAHGLLAVRRPLPDGQHLRILGAQRGHVLRVGRDRQANRALQVRVEIGLHRNASIRQTQTHTSIIKPKVQVKFKIVKDKQERAITRS